MCFVGVLFVCVFYARVRQHATTSSHTNKQTNKHQPNKKTQKKVMDEDFELGLAFKESIVPRAVEWYTGEAAPPMFGDEYDGEEGEFGEFES